MRRNVFATLLCALFLGAVNQASETLHFSLVRAVPAQDQTLEAAPVRLQLWFSQAPAAAVSQITLKRGTADVALGKTVVISKDKSLYADPAKPLEAGAYTLTWRAAGDDGHVMSGDVKFSIVPKTPR